MSINKPKPTTYYVLRCEDTTGLKFFWTGAGWSVSFVYAKRYQTEHAAFQARTQAATTMPSATKTVNIILGGVFPGEEEEAVLD